MLRRGFSPEGTVTGAFCKHRTFLLLPKSGAKLRWAGSPDGPVMAESLAALAETYPLKQTRSGRSERLTQGPTPKTIPDLADGKLVTNLGIPHITLSGEELLGDQSRASQ